MAINLRRNLRRMRIKVRKRRNNLMWREINIIDIAVSPNKLMPWLYKKKGRRK